ncbi:MAG TPA: hypothetical protein VF828_01370 [Patescibacteria group bacterium]
MSEPQTSSYAKRPLWQWIAIYLIVGGIIYAALYYFVLARRYPTTAPSTGSVPAVKVSNSVYNVRTDSSGRDYITDPSGRTLYTYSQDTANVSNCVSSCLATWPAYFNSAITPPYPDKIGVLSRQDGTEQFTYNGLPLYYFANDTQLGQMLGDNVGGFSVAR